MTLRTRNRLFARLGLAALAAFILGMVGLRAPPADARVFVSVGIPGAWGYYPPPPYYPYPPYAYAYYPAPWYPGHPYWWHGHPHHHWHHGWHRHWRHH